MLRLIGKEDTGKSICVAKNEPGSTKTNRPRIKETSLYCFCCLLFWQLFPINSFATHGQITALYPVSYFLSQQETVLSRVIA
jgi:hypothetical protein